ncbi:MAG: S-layer homology domain-containing protein [Bacillota bacterium]
MALQEGPNLIEALSGTASDSITVTRDTVAPALTLTASATETSDRFVTLSATSEPGATVTIQDQESTTLKVKLILGENTFRATATDAAGNTATATVTVTRVPRPADSKKQQVEPNRSTTVTSGFLTVSLPNGAVSESIELIVQVPGTNPALVQADTAAGLLSVVEVSAFTVPEGEAVTQLQRSITLTFTYDPAEVPDPAQLRIFYYDPAAEVWVELGGTVDTDNHTISVQVDHLTLFAVLLGSGPTLDALPSTTDRAALTVTGRGSPGRPVTLVVNGAAQGTGTVDAGGQFQLQASLLKGENRLYVSVDGLASREAVVAYQTGGGRKNSFRDTEGHWAAASVEQMVGLGVVTGYEDGTFRPEARVVRVEFAVMVARVLQLDFQGTTLPFTDAESIPDWAAGAVGAAAEAGILTGRSNGAFDPNAPITRAEVAVILSRALAYAGKGGVAGGPVFTDADQIPDWAREHVATAAGFGLITGYEDVSFRPANTTTRAEAVTMLARLVKVLEL